jgi:hypothetical protein
VTIPVATVADALKVPNTALRYKPPLSLEEIGGIYARYGLEEGAGARSASTAGAAAKPAARNVAVVWKLERVTNAMEPVKISLGITDHSYTQVTGVLKGSLKEGDALIIRSVMPNAQAPGGIRR